MRLRTLTTTVCLLGGALFSFPGVGGASPLSEAAALLASGQSIRLQTNLPSSLLMPDGFNFLQWGSSGVWDPVRREVRYIGKRASPFPYRWLVYDDATGVWSRRDLPPGLAAPQSGHGYDHNTVDPTTGDHYFRIFSSLTIYKWNGSSWSTFSLPSGSADVAASISWVPGYGVVYTDSKRFQYYNGLWHSINGGISGIGANSYHSISEFNPVANVLIYGGGEGGSKLSKWDVKANTVTTIATPPFNVGSSEAQGVIASAPDAAKFIAWRRASSSWAEYDVNANAWRTLTQSSGNGSAPQSGTPNLRSDDLGRAVIGIPISTYGVIMFIQYQEPNAAVWLYKVSDNPITLPNPPTALVVQ